MSVQSRIYDPQGMGQLIDFKGLTVGNNIYPTDIDGVIEYRDSEYIIFEIKHVGTKIPKGQRLALQRMADDFVKSGKKARVLICEHKVDDKSTPVIAALCKIKEEYIGNSHIWSVRSGDMTLGAAIQKFKHSHNNDPVENRKAMA